MSDRPAIERRKNPSRKKPSVIDVAYKIEWNSDRRTFDIYRDGEMTGGFARDQATAIGMATGEAQKEAPGLKVTVSTVCNGKFNIEWSN